MYTAHSPCFLSPLADSPLFPFSNPSLLTWNPPCCDRIRPPRSQVACKLTSPLSTHSPLPPLQIPRTQVTKRLTKMTLRIRHLLSGTCTVRSSPRYTPVNVPHVARVLLSSTWLQLSSQRDLIILFHDSLALPVLLLLMTSC
jgi:hypothetical protein